MKMVLTVKRSILCFGSDNDVRTRLASFFTEPLISAFVSIFLLVTYAMVPSIIFAYAFTDVLSYLLIADLSIPLAGLP